MDLLELWTFGIRKAGSFLSSWATASISRRTFLHGVSKYCLYPKPFSEPNLHIVYCLFGAYPSLHVHSCNL
jgi:hypothetical protein